MIRTLDRLTLSLFLKLFLAFAATAPILFVLGDLTDNLDDYFRLGVSGGAAATAYLLQYPSFSVQSFPIAAMIAVVFTIQGMTVNREIMAAKSGGISFHRIMLPVIVASLGISATALWLYEVVPGWNWHAGEILRGSQTVNLSGRADRGVFVHREESGVVLSARRLTARENRLFTPRLEVFDGGELLLDVVADRAVLEDHGWTFYEGVRRDRPGDPDPNTYSFQELILPRLGVSIEDLGERTWEKTEMTRAELAEAARLVQGGGESQSRLARRYLVERELRVALSVASFVIVLFGGPLATSSKRGGTAYGIGIALGSTIFYMLLLRLTKAFGEIGWIEPVWAAWIPNGIFLLAGLVLLMRVRT